MNLALIFAGGVGSRMKTNGTPKQFLKVNGCPVIIHTIDKFEKNVNIDKVLVVCVKEYIPLMKNLIEEYGLNKVINVVAGGKNSQGSIYNGLIAMEKMIDLKKKNIVLIHDGVRPLIDDKLINDNIRTCKKYGNSISVVKEKETVVSVKEEIILGRTDKPTTFVARAPQCFLFNDILSLNKKAIEDSLLEFDDSCSMALHYGNSLHTVESSSKNIKITTPDDYYVFKALLEMEETKKAMGFK